MHKKIIMACMALAAFAAFAVLPAVASASPELGETTAPEDAWIKTPVPSLIRAHNVGDTLMTDESGNVLTRCSSATMTGTLTTNSGTSIEGDISSASFSGTASGGACTGSFGNVTVTPKLLPWCIKSVPKTDNFEVRGGNCTEEAKAITFILDAPLGVECKYQRSATEPITGTFTTDTAGTTTDAVLSISKVKFPGESTPFPCPANGFLDMSFTLETDVEGTAPLYIR